MSRSRILHTIRVTGALALTGVPFACTDAPTRVDVRVTLDGVPVPGLELVAYPFDPQRLLDSLAAAAAEPKPDFAALERELLAFTPPRDPPEDARAAAWQAIRDSVAALADSLNATDRRSAGYGGAYQRFRRMYARLVRNSAAREAARRVDLDPLRDLAHRAGRAADSLRAWETLAYAGFDSAVSIVVAERGRAPLWGTTGIDGGVRLTLRPGAWHLQLRQPVADNPFLELVWNVPVVVSGFPFRVPVTEATADTVWRH